MHQTKPKEEKLGTFILSQIKKETKQKIKNNKNINLNMCMGKMWCWAAWMVQRFKKSCLLLEPNIALKK